MEKNTSWKLQLKRYSAVAAGIIALTTEKSKAQIIYHDVNPDSALTTIIEGLDFNNNGIYDFHLHSSWNNCDGSDRLIADDSNQIFGQCCNGSIGLLDGSNELDSIMSFGQWYSIAFLYSEACIFSCYGCTQAGPFADPFNDKFIGIKLHFIDGYHYGWIRIKVGFPFDAVKDYAYQSLPNIPIFTGAVENCDTLHVSIDPQGMDTVCWYNNTTTLHAYHDATSYLVSYQWQKDEMNIPGATSASLFVNDSASYRVDMYGYGCRDTSNSYNMVIDNFPAPVIALINDTLISDYSWGNQWYLYNQIIPGATNQSYFPLQSGTYKDRVTDTHGCYETSNLLYVTATGIIENLSPTINLMQNHHNIIFQIDPAFTGSKLLLFDILGNLKEQVEMLNSNVIFEVADLPSGIYFLQIKKDEKQWVKKIVIE